MGAGRWAQDAMTDVQGRDECGIFRRPRTISNASNPGSSHQHENINPTQERPTITLSRPTITVGNISTDCPTRERSRSITTSMREGSSTEQDRSALGIIDFHGPTHVNYVTVHSRLKSFSCWPPALPQRPQELSEAGFFYTGRSDQVKCFYCDGGLESWEPADSPWKEHQKWFKDCAFVKMRRDTEENVKRRSLRENENLEEIKRLSNSLKIEETKVEKQAQPIQRQVSEQTMSRKLEGLQKEVEILREARRCKICMEKEATIVFLPCAHLCSCANCAPVLPNCAVCRTPIQGMVRTFMV